MSSQNKLIPELRFPDFENDKEWKNSTIGEIGKFYYGKSAPKWSLSSDAPTFCVRYGELYTKFDTIISEIKSRTNIHPSDLRFSKGGEILVPRVGEVAKDFASHCCYLPFPNVAIGEMISVYETKEYPIFYTYYFRTLEKEFARVVEGQNVKNLYYVNLEPIVIGKPSIDEQKKIADCLSSLDELITAHNHKLETLKTYKKGLMQNLFPQEGEKVPKLRFKEFEKDGEWIEKTIDKIKSILTDYVANGSFQSLKENLNVLNSEDYAFYVRLTDLRAGLGHVNQKYVDESTYLFLNKSFLTGGELLMANIGANVGEVWQMPQIEKPATLAPNMIMIKFGDDIDSQFVYQYLTSEIGVKNISSVISGSGHPKISKTDLKQVKVSIPLKLDEQQKIAETLSSLDNLIKVQTNKIEQLKTHKKGLMQGLFPKVRN